MRAILCSLALALLVSANVTASPKSKGDVSDCFLAVLNSKPVMKQYKAGWLLKSINRARTYRCIGCFGFDVVFEKFDPHSNEFMVSESRLMTIFDNKKIIVKQE